MMNIATSIAFSNPKIGAFKTWDNVAPTVPLPFSNTSVVQLLGIASSSSDILAAQSSALKFSESNTQLVKELSSSLNCSTHALPSRVSVWYLASGSTQERIARPIINRIIIV